MKGQLSAEMLIVLVIIIALAALLAKTMMDSAGKASTATTERTNDVIASTTPCQSTSDCTKLGSYACDTTKGYCKAA
ncbi:MAG: hypothetical protein NTV88_01550 [Candidatus Micrarchaeota archaeon]|nr:hypothetical protein [Candidatus Micrarchaeota archaeon]